MEHDPIPRWRDLPEIPTSEEILEPAVCPPVPETETADREAYLEFQYRMLRYDGTEALRRAVNAFRNSPAMSESDIACVYDNAYFSGFFLSRQGVAFRLVFSTRRAKTVIKWQHSARLKQGSLVAISTARNSFRSFCLVGVVGCRHEERPPKVDIFLGDPEAAIRIMMDPHGTLVMVTARTGYYEAVTHAMMGLQQSRPSVFDKYLIQETENGTCVDETAVQVEESPFFDLSVLNEMCRPDKSEEQGPGFGWVNMLDGMPDFSNEISMDLSQLSALHRILTKELAIIQGPPGTGKTFTSVAGIRAMVQKWRHQATPIIVSSHTNHALDQLLALCINFSSVARLGSRSENPEIMQRSIFQLGQTFRASPDQLEPYSRADRAVSRAYARMKQLYRNIQSLVDSILPEKAILVEDLLRAKAISQKHHDEIVDDPFATETAQIESWLYPIQLTPIEPRHMRMEMAYESMGEEDEETVFDEMDWFEWDAGLEEESGCDAVLEGDFISMERGYEAMTEIDTATAEEKMKHVDSIMRVDKKLRGAIYNLWRKRLKDAHVAELARMLRQYNQVCLEKKEAMTVKQTFIVKDINIIGCTTTGLTKYRKFLESLNPKILIIEEAAETCEANIASGLFSSLHQLVLVGDHKQLKPSCDRPEMAVFPYTLNVSMFERLVGYAPHVMLKTQRRMAPVLRTVIDPFYNDLQDHPALSLVRGPVPGMGGKRLWFFNHAWPEATDSSKSKYNEREADIVARFANYLYLSGTDCSKITILTYYNAQRKKITSLLRKHRRDIKVSTVDSYQGEENDIVVLSLVRSNIAAPYSDIGFLKEENRAVVACSRARCGFFVFGSVECALKAKGLQARSLWYDIIMQFVKNKAIDESPKLPIYCDAHKKTLVLRNSDGFVCLFGGCDEKCNETRSCGHPCQMNCHPRPHEEFSCRGPCENPLFILPGHMASQGRAGLIAGTADTKPGTSSLPAIKERFKRTLLGKDGRRRKAPLTATQGKLFGDHIPKASEPEHLLASGWTLMPSAQGIEADVEADSEKVRVRSSPSLRENRMGRRRPQAQATTRAGRLTAPAHLVASAATIPHTRPTLDGKSSALDPHTKYADNALESVMSTREREPSVEGESRVPAISSDNCNGTNGEIGLGDEEDLITL
ncbi:hypothetical protein MKZ38_004735 [Zalerion maritima]|uniref:Uncharacterized protein n=1 Tax=Zalerion maritima TaxID=339359 RepID=A0AAD5WWC7_9PEZI|nr:hypothetical protein MKZ38_004735 [Zalerion maritima]